MTQDAYDRLRDFLEQDGPLHVGRGPWSDLPRQIHDGQKHAARMLLVWLAMMPMLEVLEAAAGASGEAGYDPARLHDPAYTRDLLIRLHKATADVAAPFTARFRSVPAALQAILKTDQEDWEAAFDYGSQAVAALLLDRGVDLEEVGDLPRQLFAKLVWETGSTETVAGPPGPTDGFQDRAFAYLFARLQPDALPADAFRQRVHLLRVPSLLRDASGDAAGRDELQALQPYLEMGARAAQRHAGQLNTRQANALPASEQDILQAEINAAVFHAAEVLVLQGESASVTNHLLVATQKVAKLAAAKKALDQEDPSLFDVSAAVQADLQSVIYG